MMKFSEAIRLGSMAHEQAYGDYFAYVNDGRVRMIIGSCALGAAAVAVGRADDANESDMFEELWGAASTYCACPVEKCYHFGSERMPLFEAVPHLNDDHRWTREEIAHFVWTVEEAEVLRASTTVETAPQLVVA